MMWPGAAITQSVLLILVWVHGCIGLYFLLQMKAWFPRVSLLLHSIAVLLPVLAIAGFTVSARQIYAQADGQKPLTGDQMDAFRSAGDTALVLFIVIAGTVIAYRIIRTISDRFGPKIKIQYAGNRTVTTQVGPTLLDISRMHGVPHASVCGGRARCSTCRVRILEGLDELPAADEADSRC